jgi:hypothetical protein
MIHYTDWRITANLLVSESVMAKRPTGKNQHERTRDDHATELAEDYVEAIADLIEAHGQCRIRDLARHFGVTHVTVNRAVSRFQVSCQQNGTDRWNLRPRVSSWRKRPAGVMKLFTNSCWRLGLAKKLRRSTPRGWNTMSVRKRFSA